MKVQNFKLNDKESSNNRKLCSYYGPLCQFLFIPYYLTQTHWFGRPCCRILSILIHKVVLHATTTLTDWEAFYIYIALNFQLDITHNINQASNSFL